MVLSLRQIEIVELARAEGKVLVEELAARFGVTLQTIRRDLCDLADAGRLARVHGGAVLRSGVANIGYAERRNLNAAAKAAIGRACAAAIPDNSSLFLNIGTTTEAVARALLRHRNLTVVTNNLNIANILAESESCEVGDLTREAIAAFKVDHAIIGTSALDGEGELLDFDSQEVHVSRAIIGRARQAYLVADHSKLTRAAPVRIGSLRDLAAIFTDRPLPQALARKCTDWGTAVNVAGPG
jgi:DeoR family transcriptional regulator, glycerol-3-phosphate regulon repressor